jgi:hypothetical protein
MWSYGTDFGRRGLFHYPNCPAPYRMNTGIRGPDAAEGALIVAARSDDMDSVNARAQEQLLRSRPYGNTPIAGALDDVYYYFANDRDVQAVPIADRHVVLVTDGYPDDDYRSYGCACQSGDPARDNFCGTPDCIDPLTCANHEDNMKCPYPHPEDGARYLVFDGHARPDDLPVGEPWRQGPSRQVASFSVVGFNVSDDIARAKLDAIATVGGSAGARFVTTGPELRAALADILDDILVAR